MQIPETQQEALRRAPRGSANEKPAKPRSGLRAVPRPKRKRAVSTPPAPEAIAAAEKLFLEHLPLIERIIADSARRSSFLPQDAEDFGSWVKLRLIEDDYRIPRAFKGLSSVPTFLTTVIKNLGRDYQDHLWGKYRPSAKAKALGTTAVALERLLVRDGFELDEAIRILTTRLGLDASEDELQQLAVSLKPRQRRRFVDAEVLETQGTEDDPEERADALRHQQTQERLQKIVEVALAKLSAQDFLILQLFYGEAMPISRIAKTLHLEQRPLYRRHQSCLAMFQEALLQAGIGWPEVRALLSWGERDVRLSLMDNEQKRPSNDID
jgi:RNA polymerase sigma factor (sigma-70 family)